MAMTNGRVLLADDHAPTRAVVRHALEASGYQVVAEVADAETAISEVESLRPHLAILDIRMPGNGLRAAEIIRTEHPETYVMMLTVSSDDTDLFAALAAGATGYWLKGQDAAEIPVIVRRILAGETVLTNTLVRRLVVEWRSQDLRQRTRERLPNGSRLTLRECEVVELLDQGLTTSEIAQRLFVADVTVRTHIASIIRKVNAVDREDAVRRFRRSAESTPEASVGR
jgi:DNA-binding NarL/FixJ family response regulator